MCPQFPYFGRFRMSINQFDLKTRDCDWPDQMSMNATSHTHPRSRRRHGTYDLTTRTGMCRATAVLLCGAFPFACTFCTEHYRIRYSCGVHLGFRCVSILLLERCCCVSRIDPSSPPFGARVLQWRRLVILYWTKYFWRLLKPSSSLWGHTNTK